MRAVFAAPYESAPGTTRNLPGWLANGSYYQKKRTLAILAAPTACGGGFFEGSQWPAAEAGRRRRASCSISMMRKATTQGAARSH